MPNTNRKYLENKELLKNPKIRAMLDVIGIAEGATYNTRVGGATFNDLSKKPGKSTYIPSIKQNSTAEGRYQFLNSTWGGVATDLGISDFSPESQDIAAIELIKRRGALNDILTDNFDNAIYKLSPEWASLPTPTGKGYYAGQKAKNINKLRSIFSGASSATPTEYDTKEVKPQYQDNPGFLTVNQGEQQTAGEWTEPKEVSEAKTQLVQAQNEENFLKEFQAIVAQQEEIKQEQPNYLQSQELFTLAPTEQIQYNTSQEFQQGGQIPVDKLGMWKYPNQEVIVPSNIITMKPNPFTGEAFTKPILGISMQTGEQKIMQPNKNYRFKNTNSVREVPLDKRLK